MKLQQLRYIWEVAHNKLNVSATSQLLYTSQPGISKQIRLLEDELGIEIFSRSGKHLTHITTVGKQVINIAGEILKHANGIKQVAQEFNDQSKGKLSLVASHTESRYFLPRFLSDFKSGYPDVTLTVHENQSSDIMKMVSEGLVDFGLTTESQHNYRDLIICPCFQWSKSILVPKNHPLTKLNYVSLKDIVTYSLVAYFPDSTSQALLEDVFMNEGLIPKVDVTSVNADVVENYVVQGFGVGIVDSIAVNNSDLSKLVALDASHLFSDITCYLVVRRGLFLRQFMYDFLNQLASHLTKDIVDNILISKNKFDVEQILSNIKIPAI